MVPPVFVSLDELPLTPSGKMIVWRCRRGGVARPSDLDDATPMTPVEELLAGIWRRCCRSSGSAARPTSSNWAGIRCGGADHARIRDSFGIELPVRALLEATTVSRLAERVEAVLREEQGCRTGPACQPRTDALPLSFAQEAVCGSWSSWKSWAAYHLPFASVSEVSSILAHWNRRSVNWLRRHESAHPLRDAR